MRKDDKLDLLRVFASGMSTVSGMTIQIIPSYDLFNAVVLADDRWIGTVALEDLEEDDVYALFTDLRSSIRRYYHHDK